jgi:hypothetical protein
LIRAFIELHADLDAVKGRFANFFQYGGLFVDDLTKRGYCVLLSQLQPKSGFLPETGCGETSSGA